MNNAVVSIQNENNNSLHPTFNSDLKCGCGMHLGESVVCVELHEQSEDLMYWAGSLGSDGQYKCPSCASVRDPEQFRPQTGDILTSVFG